MKKRRDPFQAIADPTRRAILVLLASQAMTAGAIAQQFEVARPTVSKHLHLLLECDLVVAQQQGREVMYTLQVEQMKEIENWLEQFKKLWIARYNNLDNLLTNLQNKTQ